MSKSNVMNNKEKEQQQLLQAVQEIQDFLVDFSSVSELYEHAAKAMSALMYVSDNIAEEEKHHVRRMVSEYMSVLELLKPLEKKGGEL